MTVAAPYTVTVHVFQGRPHKGRKQADVFYEECLIRLWEYDKPMSSTQMRYATGKTGNTVAASLHVLWTQGYLVRSRATSGANYFMYSLTKRGIARAMNVPGFKFIPKAKKENPVTTTATRVDDISVFQGKPDRNRRQPKLVQHRYLLALWEHDREMNSVELGRYTGLGQGSSSSAMSTLFVKQLVARRGATSGWRTYYMYKLTSKGISEVFKIPGVKLVRKDGDPADRETTALLDDVQMAATAFVAEFNTKMNRLRSAIANGAHTSKADETLNKIRALFE